ncbi:MAG: tellurium resistance protein TerC [Deltaproteobacteria bacterium]|nr:tellurium resistance protein TerC [Deltaproteobacteria bacterium]
MEHIFTLFMLVLLQAVLGFDNLLYIALEARRAPENEQAKVRTWGIGLAVILRIALLFILLKAIGYFQDPLFHIAWGHWVEGTFNLHSLIVLAGGVFILNTALKEIFHMITFEQTELKEMKEKAAAAKVITWIVLMNLVFSFDSIGSAMALTKVFWVMATAIVIGGILMIALAGSVANFLQKNRMYEVMGLFILLVVGIMLISEGGHLAHLVLWGAKITPMTKATFYFVIGILILSDIVQSRYQKKLLAKKNKG